MKNGYGFYPEEAARKVAEGIREYAADKGGKAVLGISGGKDSLVCARLAADALGPDNVCGVMMPNGTQGDLCDSLEAIKVTGIKSYAVDISKAYAALEDQLRYNGVKPSQDTLINMAPRIRMTTLYAVAQTFGGIVLCTDNLDERLTGYFTFYGDGAGSYAPLRYLTVGEVVAIGMSLGLPERLVCKKPGDGLQPQGDEERMGIAYADLDALIRTGVGTDEFKDRVTRRYAANRFKTDIVDIPGPKFEFPDFVTA